MGSRGVGAQTQHSSMGEGAPAGDLLLSRTLAAVQLIDKDVSAVRWREDR